MKQGVAFTLLAAAVWLVGGTWYYDCKIKRVCGPERVSAIAAPAPPASLTAAAEIDEVPAPTNVSATAATAPPTAAPAPVDPLQAMLTVTFDARSSALVPPADAAEKLAALKRGVAQGQKILVLGHSDGSGARVRIGVVSQQRADALRDWLLTQGIAASAIAAVESREDRDPIASNSRAEGRAKNRRAEARLISPP